MIVLDFFCWVGYSLGMKTNPLRQMTSRQVRDAISVFSTHVVELVPDALERCVEEKNHSGPQILRRALAQIAKVEILRRTKF